MSIILFRFLVITLLTCFSFFMSNVRSALTYMFRAMDARLQTATCNNHENNCERFDQTAINQELLVTSSGEQYSTISVHRLLHLIVPRFC